MRKLLRRFTDLPIRRKLTLLLTLSTGLGMLLAAVPLIGYAWIKAREAAERDLASVGAITAGTSTAALLFNDERTAREILGALKAKPAIDRGCLYGIGTGGVPELAARFETAAGGECPAEPGPAGLSQDLEHLSLVRPVVEGGETIGWLHLRQDLRGLRQAIAAQVGITLAILLASFVASISFAWGMQRLLADPLLRLAGVARRVSETRDYGLRAEKSGDDEVGRLIDDFNQMLDRIALREREIEGARLALEQEVGEKTRANAELAQALTQLREAQAQLVQNERLASLGALVAGVAHEINTPVGVGVTAASTLLDRSAQLRKAYDGGELRRSDLERFVAVAEESSNIILKNLQRAADLIHSFKQVAVDQTSGERRRFAFKAYIEEVLLSLAPRLKKSGHAVEVVCPAALSVDSYPGAIAQILANLVGNSLVHAYADGHRGKLRIEVGIEHGRLFLRYSDDGCGIPREHLAKIYDPFFTTRRGSGGSGLGLHIVHNLVTQMLGGSIEVRSEPGKGTEFTVRFPPEVHKAVAA